VLNYQVTDGNAACGSSVQIATVIVLLDENAVPNARLVPTENCNDEFGRRKDLLGDCTQGNLVVCHPLDCARIIHAGLDANA
jgi:hypothetical protein